MVEDKSRVKILGIDFLNLECDEVFCILEKEGGLLTVPSGPGLSTIPEEPQYYKALLNSDYVLADSGLMALTWNSISKTKIIRISGLGFINNFIKSYTISTKRKSIFLINPNLEEQEANFRYFKELGFNIRLEDNYVAPLYSKSEIRDSFLLELIEKTRPHWVFLNIGGGVQEELGYWLRSNLSYKPAIVCTGAAIAFKTGKQVQIPEIIDKIYLGWLWRVFSNPKAYGKRFWDAKKIVLLIFKHRSELIILSK